MVKVTFKLSDCDTIEIEIKAAERLGTILEKSAQVACVELGGFIAVRNGKVLTVDSLVEQNDEIDVYPAISGG